MNTFTLDTLEEEWRPVDDSGGAYEVSNLGRVRSLPRVTVRGGHPRRIAGIIMSPKLHPKGYRFVCLWIDKKRVTRWLHRLVAAAFVPNPSGKPEVDHIDNNRSNCRAENLRWVTRAENMAHAASQGRLRGTLTRQQIISIRALWPQIPRGKKRSVAESYGITYSQLHRIGTWRAHRHAVPYPGKDGLIYLKEEEK